MSRGAISLSAIPVNAAKRDKGEPTLASAKTYIRNENKEFARGPLLALARDIETSFEELQANIMSEFIYILLWNLACRID